jgi:hypothetical protein
LLVRLVAVAAIAACAEPPPPISPGQRLAEAREQLTAQLAQCSETHGYAPRTATGVGAHELAPGELAWRQCAYDAVRVYARANPSLASLYEQLIAEDIAMTTAIQQGTMTRSERQLRIDRLRAQIDAAETRQVQFEEFERERQMQQKQFLVDSLRSFY